MHSDYKWYKTSLDRKNLQYIVKQNKNDETLLVQIKNFVKSEYTRKKCDTTVARFLKNIQINAVSYKTIGFRIFTMLFVQLLYSEWALINVMYDL